MVENISKNNNLDKEVAVELKEKIEEVKKETNKALPLIDFENNRYELREISERTVKYLSEIKPDFRIGVWEIIPRVVVEVITSVVDYLSDNVKPDSDFMVNFGSIFKIGTEATSFNNTDKSGTINPILVPGEGFKYESDKKIDDILEIELLEIVNKMDSDLLNEDDLPSTFDHPKEIVLKLKQALAVLASSYDLQLMRWINLLFIVYGFFKTMKNYLIEHKDDYENGLIIELARLIDMGIERFKEEGEESQTNYKLILTPNQKMRLKVKGDNVTEQLS